MEWDRGQTFRCREEPAVQTGIGLESAFLGEGIAGKSGALGGFRNLDANRRGIGSGEPSGTKHGKLVEDFVVELRDEVVLAIRFAAPDLPELHSFDGQRISFNT